MAIAKRKKRFFDVKIPIVGKETQLQAFEIGELAGRYLSYDLTRYLRGKSTILQTVVSVEKEEAIATPKKVTLMPYYLKRMVRKGTNYVEDSFYAESKDAKVRIKPFLVTRRKVSRAVRKALREKAREELTNYLKTKSSQEVFEEILNNSLQKSLSLKLKKIYPLSSCEIRVFKVESELESVPKEEVKKEAPKKETKTFKDVPRESYSKDSTKGKEKVEDSSEEKEKSKKKE